MHTIIITLRNKLTHLYNGLHCHGYKMVLFALRGEHEQKQIENGFDVCTEPSALTSITSTTIPEAQN